MVDPNFHRVILPASADDIAILASFFEYPLPQDYKDFLAVMGAYDGGLFWRERVFPDITEVIAYCRDRGPVCADGEYSPCVPFAVGVDFDGLGLRIDPGATHPAVVILQGMLPGKEICPSLPALAWAHGFTYEQGATGYRVLITNLERRFTIHTLEAVVKGAGYELCWFSRPTKRYLRKDTALLMLHESGPSTVRAYLGSVNGAIIGDALAELKRSLGEFDYEMIKAMTLPMARVDREHLTDYRDE